MKPNLAYKIKPGSELDRIVFPCFVTPKLDGIRALVGKEDQGFLSRKLKRLPNEFMQATMWQARLIGMDCELILGDPTDDPFRRTSSAVMSRDGEPNLTLWIFDDYLVGGPYRERYDYVARRIKSRTGAMVRLVEHRLVKTVDELLKYEENKLKDGYEGIMIRSPDGRYKYGRSTLREQGLMALKRFEDSEAVVVGMLPRMKNTNAAKLDETGATKRSSHKAGKVAQDTLGAMLVRDVHTGVEFELGMGSMTMEEAKKAWDEYQAGPFAFKDKYLAKYKFFPSGSKDKPRLPTWTGWRSPEDLS